MFLDRQDNRKEVQQAYRKQLKAEVENKRSRVFSNKNTQQYRPEKETFSLIANIQREQNERKKKNQVYYDDLRNQMELNRRQKQQKQQQKKQRELEEQNKIKDQQRRLQDRYQEQLRKQNKGNRNAVTEIRNDPPPQTIKRKRELSMNRQQLQPLKMQLSQNDTRISREKALSVQTPDINLRNYQSSIETYSAPPVNLYPNRIQNETFNYVSRNVYKDSYYKELLGQRRKLQEQANQISQLNRIFNAERYKRRQESKGLEQLRNLEKMLDGKNSEYLDLNFTEGRPSISQSGKLKPLNKIQKQTIFAQRINKDEWRKLD